VSSVGISVKNVSFSYEDHQVLKDVSIEVPDKQFVGLIGPNGSGKSTLMKCIYRILSPDSGQILLDGKPVGEMSYRESAQKLAVVAQSNPVEFEFTVRDMVLMGRSPYKKRLERENADDVRILQETLDLVHMRSYENRSLQNLSGGEQQRVIFARALAQQTNILIMDEPTNQLDVTFQLDLMRTVKRQAITTLVSFHDLNIAALFCDYLYCIRDGEIVANGTPDEVLTRDLIRDVYHVDSEITHDCDGRVHILFRSGLREDDAPASDVPEAEPAAAKEEVVERGEKQ
jgi:iron complex transport system ATP-binding protein